MESTKKLLRFLNNFHIRCIFAGTNARITSLNGPRRNHFCFTFVEPIYFCFKYIQKR